MTARLVGAALLAAAFACGGSSETPADGGTCVEPVVSSALPASQVLTFGQKGVGTKVSFDVPAGTASVVIVQQAVHAGASVVFNGTTLDNSTVPAGVTVPGGSVIFNDSACDGPAPDGGAPPSCTPWTDPETRLAFYGGGTPVTGAFTMPNTSAAVANGIPSGPWSFVVNDYAAECSVTSGCTGGSTAGIYDVSVLLKPQSVTAHNLDVAFYIVGSGTGSLGALTATTAPNEPSVTRMISTLKQIYAQVGITVRPPAFYDVSAADRARFGTSISIDRTGPCDELHQMFTLSGQHAGNTLNLFLVQAINQSATDHSGTVVGIDGTIPGPSSLNGTVHSGAVVSMADLFFGTCLPGTQPDISRCGADSVAYIAAHEGGHFLGLFHTTESSGDFFDSVADTLKCPCLSCASTTDRPKCTQSNNTAVIHSSQCKTSGCGGGDNLMFWDFDNTATGVLTADQGAIMKANPLVQ